MSRAQGAGMMEHEGLMTRLTCQVLTYGAIFHLL